MLYKRRTYTSIQTFIYYILHPFQNNIYSRVFTLIKKTRKILTRNALFSVFIYFLWFLTNKNSVNKINVFEIYTLPLLHTLKIYVFVFLYSFFLTLDNYAITIMRNIRDDFTCRINIHA